MNRHEMVSVVIIALWKADRLIDLVASIMSQLDESDEILIVVEQPIAGVPSNMTREVAQEIARQVPIVRVIASERRGRNAGFEQAIKSCRGEVVFLAEPGDVWKPEKVSTVLSTSSTSGAALVLHDVELYVPKQGKHFPSFFSMTGDQAEFTIQQIRYSFMGSCMAFRKPLHEFFLPFPDEAVVYGQWIGLVAEKYGGVALLTKNLAVKTIDDATDSLSILASISARQGEQRRLQKILKKREKELKKYLRELEERQKKQD